MPGDDIPARLQAAGIALTSYSQFAALACSAIERLEALRVRYRKTRFEAYNDFLARAAQRSYPRTIDWDKDRARQLYEIEAIGQFIQLASALSLSGKVDTALLIKRLSEVVCGPEVPAADEPDDRPRNILLELTTASLLERQHFGVELTSAREDLVLHVPGAPPLPVECKRPASSRSVGKNVHKARRQLRDLQDRYPDGGVFVLGLDRVVGMSGELPRADAPEEIPALVTEMLHEWATSAAKVGGQRLAKVCPIVMTVMAGAVFSSEPPLPTAVLRTAWLPIGGDAKRMSLLGTLTSEFRVRIGPPLDSLLT